MTIPTAALTGQQAALREQSRAYITDALAQGITEIEQPAGLWAEIREAFGPRATVFSTAGWAWVNQAFTEAREAQA